MRVDVALLDGLMTTVGQLVLARNRLLELVDEGSAPDLHVAAQRMSLITAELQRSVMETRMQPISTAWAKFPRVVRDLALTLGKQVRIETGGGETELDRSIVEAVKDPLTHLVRNAVDHGIELPEARRAAGKPEEGVLTVRAWHEGGQVGIEVTDDGDGIRADALLARAVATRAVTVVEARRMSERDALELIFLPGFTTSEQVTNVSGRGIGMDVVRANIERVGGSVEIWTEPGRGTTFKIRIPLTLAIVSAFLVSAGGERYAIPQVNLLELVHVERDAIELLHDAPVIRHRGGLLALVDLARELDVVGVSDRDVVPVVVLQAEDRRFGLVVESVDDPSEVVVKPLGGVLTGHEVFAGATILGDGRVGLILDVVGLARRAGVVDVDARRAPERTRRRPSPVVRRCCCACTRPGGSRCRCGWSSAWWSAPTTASGSCPSGARASRCRPGRPAGRAPRGRAADGRRVVGRAPAGLGGSQRRAGRRGRGPARDRRGGRAARAPAGQPAGRPRHDGRGRQGDRGAGPPGVAGDARARPAARGGGRVMRQLATFSVQGRTLGVDVARVREVTRARELTPVPLAGPAIAGLMNLRGEIVTAIDLRVRLGLPPVDADEVPGMHVVLSGAEPVSLLVDDVGDVVEVDEEAFEPPPIAVGGPAGELILGAHPREDVLLLELDLDRALDARTEGTR